MLKYIFMIFLLLGLPATAWSKVAPADLSAQRPLILGGFQLADQGRLNASDAARLASHPLHGWVEATLWRKRIATATPAEVRAVLARHDGQPAADWLREAWLLELARRKEWTPFRADYRPSASVELRCAELAARLATGASDAAWTADVQAIWLSGSGLPATCDAPFAALQARGQLGEDLRWQRIELALGQGQVALARFLARSLPANAATLAASYADFVEAPHARTATWPRDARSRRIAALGLAGLARRDPEAARTQLATLGPALDLDEAQRGQVLYQVALWTVASYLPGSADRLAEVPESAYDERLHEWRVREAMNRRDTAAALAAIAKMPPAQRADSRWQYFEARLRERNKESELASALYTQAANAATFHGFLAADRLKLPYALCPLQPSDDAALRQRVAANPGLVRALELFRIDRTGPAIREWAALLRGLGEQERYVAIDFALDAGWHDRGVFTIGDAPEAMQYYALRFPLPHERTIRREARKHALDPAWVAAQTRAESAFMAHARSPANARGLMQLLPTTADLTAKRQGIAYRGVESLYDPDVNIILGTAHLRFELDQQGGLPYQAIAAYNAGPAPVARWNRDRPGFEPDFWIETVTYKETRDYVARVLAFSVIYDWRLDGDAVPVTERMLGRTVDASSRRKFRCPTPSSASSTP
ncbi:MAG TPA: transglycosylase SLT domain-containing protein [Arenimonas sp.]|uniref:transglycosylase SLT domain-containing protein n=1 Tax=Arenimonas sp. TaxID=1872635 RepID=UPI002D807B88|nr:transglycosylase SLT domain-containing protein [Arenimonas sp.]HEU0154327.1 transglycosylase SLT domain-containing protein [Arenimonas sp.]